MSMFFKAILLIARSVLIEAVRRREIYVIVLVSTLLIGAVMMVDFFEIEGLNKFYREVALKVMSIATALTVIVLAARQLPREFEARTIYPLMARPISRWTFLLGKLAGVMLAAMFCFALFMTVYVTGTLYIGGTIPWLLFVEYIYLQLVMLVILSSLSFWLSMVFNFDAAITIGVLFYALAATLTQVTTYLYYVVGQAGKAVLLVLTYAIPQLTLFDLSVKAVHAEYWPPVGWSAMALLTLYGMVFALIYFSFAMLCFRRRAL